MKYLVSILFVCSIIFAACKKEELFRTDSNTALSFSTDTLKFDTVFTSIGSATRYFKVRNTYSQSIKISNIFLNNKPGAKYRLNIDGVANTEFKNVEIAPNDSIYVFVEVTIDPNQPLSVNPFVQNTELIFETNGNTQKVILESFGQNANYITGKKGGVFAELKTGGVVDWNDAKPYVIYGVLFIDSTTLRIAKGTHIYMHGGLSKYIDASGNKNIYNDGIIYVINGGNLDIQGTLLQPVVIQADRLESDFKDTPGQWAGIILGSGTNGNSMTYTTVKNSKIGVRVDSAASLSLKSCQFYNTSGSALLLSHATVSADNCLVYNTGGNCIQVEFGGNYNFNYCTLASYGTKSPALSMNNIRCYQISGLTCTQSLGFPLNANLTNCILYGSKDDEIDLFDAIKLPNTFNYKFSNCVYKIKDLALATKYPAVLTTNSINCINSKFPDKLFLKPSDDNYRLDSLSVAYQKALPISNIPIDLVGKPRGSTPDIGAYQWK
jgi:hypothetical protein